MSKFYEFKNSLIKGKTDSERYSSHLSIGSLTPDEIMALAWDAALEAAADQFQKKSDAIESRFSPDIKGKTIICIDDVIFQIRSMKHGQD